MDIVTYYQEFRTELFLSSLTLGTFLFTMKTFIIQTIKKEVYDHKSHRRLADNKAADSGDMPKYYDGLKSLARVIFWSIIVAVGNALIQVSVGYFEHPVSALFCIVFSIFSWLFFGFVLKVVSDNMQDMILYAEKDARGSARQNPDSGSG